MSVSEYVFCSCELIVHFFLFQSVSYDGRNRRYVYTNLPRPVGLSVFGSQLYWADASLRKVSQALFLISSIL